MENGWDLPPKGFVKVNVFGVFFHNPLSNGNTSGLGIVVRDSEGDILLMVSGSLQIMNERANELWAMLLGLRACLYVREHNVILETEDGEAVAEWEGWKAYIDPTYEDVIRSLVKRTTDKRLKLHVSVVNESKNHLARYLAKDGALNRTLPVIMPKPFGRVREIWHLDMGLGTTEFGFDLVTEEQYRKIKEGDSNEAMGQFNPDAEGSRDMECSGFISEKFIRVLTAADTTLDELKIPRDFVRKYGSRLEDSLLLKFRNGYEIAVVFKNERGSLLGVFSIFEDFGLEGGKMLLFEYNGVRDFNVFVIGKDLTEIIYPNIVHFTQNRRPRTVSLKNGGLKYVHFVKEEEPLYDEFEPPFSFKERCGMLQGYHTFLFSNGKKTVGQYNHENGKYQGLAKICSILGLQNFGKFNLVLFSYEEMYVTTVSVFDDHFLEVFLPGTPLSSGLNSHNPTVRGRIEITIQPCHMYKYSYGVDISTEYNGITNFWRNIDYITVYAAGSAWKLQVRYRGGGESQRTAIKDGWMQFRDDLGLVAGDVLVLECADSSIQHFCVQVIKNHGE
ncbi:hypothetical protein DCAR_0519990 [Daucus carota subsp. sativus]|uniref:TF-B3 domain-containing protein n=1 Tax=Daucus carota subsp. sativus TaxID=79200 RepID=A0AAF1B212_DAUCS|nr:hypothetical protein DCAR_0519990 [Daucus carota subsp. sativus]